MDSSVIESVIKLEEGFLSTPYVCSEGYVTIGYGTKLHEEKGLDPSRFCIRVNQEVALSMLLRELDEINRRLMSSHVGGTDGIFDRLSPNRKAMIYSMAYQMGVGGVLKFHGMWAAIALEDYEKASAEMIDSRWARQTPQRAERHASVMHSDELFGIYEETT
jgi:lysozyme